MVQSGPGSHGRDWTFRRGKAAGHPRLAGRGCPLIKNRYWIGAIVLALGLGAGIWAIADGGAESGLLPYRDASAVARGREIYASECASCHGDNLQGEADWRTRDADGYMPAPPHDASGHTWHHPDEQLIAITALGLERLVGQGYQSRMPGFADILSQDDIAAVLAYVKSTWPDDIRRQHDRINADAG